jgi:hypothetical protein
MSNKRRSEDSPRKTNMSMTAAQATDGSSRLQTMKQLKTEYSDLVKYNDDKLLNAKFKIGSVSDAAIEAAESVSTELNKQLALYLGTTNELARYGPMVSCPGRSSGTFADNPRRNSTSIHGTFRITPGIAGPVSVC